MTQTTQATPKSPADWRGLDVRQFHDFILVPVLQRLAPEIAYSDAARRLMLGTATHESARLRFIDQKTNGPGDPPGPAYGVFQMEEATYRDCWSNFLQHRGSLSLKVREFGTVWPEGVSAMHGNLLYATAMARAQFYRMPPPLPAGDDLEALARYWKTHWNTAGGGGTVAEWLLDYPKGF